MVRFSLETKAGSKFDPLSVIGCFNCGAPDHMMNACKTPLNVSRAGSRRIDDYEKKGQKNTFHMVLADLCSQLEHSLETEDAISNSPEEDESSDRQTFETLLSSQESSISFMGIGSNQELHKDSYDKHFNYIKDDVSNIRYSDSSMVYSDSNSNFDILVSETVGDTLGIFGACIVTRAQRSVIGLRQARAYCHFTKIDFEPKSTHHLGTHRFGDKIYAGLGTINIRVPIDYTNFLQLYVVVADVDVPLLIGLDIMQEFQMRMDIKDGKTGVQVRTVERSAREKEWTSLS